VSAHNVISTPFLGTIIIPVFNEADIIPDMFNQLLPCIGRLWKVVVVDGGSSDQTLKTLQQYPITVLSSESGRAIQMNSGAQAAEGDLLVFLHADTRLPDNFSNIMSEFLRSNREWGRFNVALDSGHILLKTVGWCINLRSRLTGISTGDQCLFMKQYFFKTLNGFAEQPLMEDIDFCWRAKKQGKPYCVRDTVTTSARRWLRNGIMKTILQMWCIRFAYFMGVSPETLYAWYYGARR
jgi:rSAM/selenodomain-associated transferase 2